MSIDASVSSCSPKDGQAQLATHTVYLALGANIGERRDNLALALQHLRKVMEIGSVSSLYETEPVGYLDQPRFLNAVCRGTTRLDANDLLKYIKEIEAAIGRKPSFRNGPRPIDIDILFYDDQHLTQDQLTIPHPRLHERAFVLVPLAEIAPEMVDPVSGQTIQEWLAIVPQDGISKLSTEGLDVTRDGSDLPPDQAWHKHLQQKADSYV